MIIAGGNVVWDYTPIVPSKAHRDLAVGDGRSRRLGGDVWQLVPASDAVPETRGAY
jgi:hypothetical protein